MDLILKGLEVTGIGLAAVFIVMFILYGTIILIQQLFKEKKKEV